MSVPKDLNNVSKDEIKEYLKTLVDRFISTLNQPNAPEALSRADWVEHLFVFEEYDEPTAEVDEAYWLQPDEEEED